MEARLHSETLSNASLYVHILYPKIESKTKKLIEEHSNQRGIDCISSSDKIHTERNRSIMTSSRTNNCCTNINPNNARQRRRTETTKRTLLTLTVAALFAVSSSSAFSILQSPSRSPTTAIRYDNDRIDHDIRGGRLSAAVVATAPKRSRATTLLLVTPLLDADDSNDAITIEEKVATTTLGKRLHNWKCWIQFWRNNTVRNLTSRRRHHRAARVVVVLCVAEQAVQRPDP